MKLKIFFLLLGVIVLILITSYSSKPISVEAQTVPGRGGTGDILLETWETTKVYTGQTQTTRLYNEFDSAPSGEIKTWTRSLSIDHCFTQSKVVDGTCARKNPDLDPAYYGPLLNNQYVGVDLFNVDGRVVSRHWIKENTGQSTGSRLNLLYTYLSNYANRRIYARYYMKFPQPLPVVQSGGSWTSVGVEMKAHGWDTHATIMHNYDRNHYGWMASPHVNVTFTPFKFESSKWYKMDMIWDMFYDSSKGRWQTYVDGVKWGEGVGQMAVSSGIGIWIFNLYGDMFANQVRGEMYIGDVILSTQPIDDSLPTIPPPPPPPPSTVPQAPFNGSIKTIPGKVEAEDYDVGGQGVSYNELTASNLGGSAYRSDPVDIRDVSTEKVVGYFQNGEWLEYTLNNTSSTPYRLTINGITNSTQRSFKFEWNGNLLGTVPVPYDASTNWQTFQNASIENISIPQGEGVLRITLEGGDIGDINWFTLLPMDVSRGPFGGNVRSIPGVLQAEDFDEGGQDISYNETTAINQGGSTYRPGPVDIRDVGNEKAVGYFVNGEWLEYSVNNTSASTYTIRLTGISASSGRSFKLDWNGSLITTISAPLDSTTNWQSFLSTTVENVTIPQGQGILRITLQGGNDADVEKIEFIKTIDPGGSGVCGDGIVQQLNSNNVVEYCDDGNNVDGDQCSSTCHASCSIPKKWNSSMCIVDAAALGTYSFFRGINLGGDALTIDGNAWEGKMSTNYTLSPAAATSDNQTVTLSPSTDTSRSSMIRSFAYDFNGLTAAMSLPNGKYQVYVYNWEDGGAAISFDLTLEGIPVLSNFSQGTTGQWRKLGPYNVNLTDGKLDMAVTGGAVNISGIEIHKESTTSSLAENCRGDYDANGTIDIIDFQKFAQNYKKSSIDCGLDVNGIDCYLGIQDFQGFASSYKIIDFCKIN